MRDDKRERMTVERNERIWVKEVVDKKQKVID